jgi:hypothetical protein
MSSEDEQQSSSLSEDLPQADATGQEWETSSKNAESHDSDDQESQEDEGDKKKKGKKRGDEPKGHAPVRKPANGRLDYKSIVILSILKVIKKIKTFTIRKLLRDIKELQNPTKPEYKPKGNLEAMVKQCDELKKIKNPQLKILIPFLIQYEFKDSLDKYWPILLAENVTKECEYNGLLKVALTELQQRDITLDDDIFSRASTEVDSVTHCSGSRL